ncbi:N-acetylmuramoyl-L-alanine amidase [Clostridium sp. MSJ-8]|uniref:N-acetylmuramoyl-L-alanine amidase n=1 Tax=Clostridium sp. MSJ-8 TaxID=2841510 RepID=UPI001C0F162C|nr:N-acetylmuramoyl-L-alanine amidase [Clostridium sp. MSJ-8]MBU5488237.1 N-acetylmuramoyl-L-alanine amidase [Clostridium sp. MSJ-8]
MKKSIRVLIGIFIIINIFSVVVLANTSNNTNVSTEVQSEEQVYSNDKTINVKYTTHVQNIGWQDWVTDGELAGTSGEGLRVEGLMIKLEGAPDAKIYYTAHVQNMGWQDWVTDGELAGTSGEGLRVEAIKIRTENLPIGYHIEYRAHVENIGWQDWVTDGEIAGTSGKGYRVEGIEIKVVENDKFYDKIQYNSKLVNSDEWMGVAKEGNTSGKIGNDISNFKINVDKSIATIRYKAYIQEEGWQDWMSNDEIAGKKNKRIKAIKIESPDISDDVQLLYRVYISNKGWQSWKYNGQIAGDIENYNCNIQAIQIKFEKDIPNIEYQAHVENIGWQDWVSNGELAGTSGEGLRVEGIIIKMNNFDNGSISYRTYVQNKGWLGWKHEGELGGTSGEGLRVEAIQIKGDNLPDTYQIQYRVHIQNKGWQEWKTDGEIAGTIGEGLRLEAIQIRIVRAVRITPIQCIDKPADSDIITDNFSVTGWSLSYSGVEKVQAYINDKFLGETVPNISREDVYSAYSEYKSHNSGYEINNLDITTIAPGKQTLEIRQFGKDGYIHHMYKTITIRKKDNITTIDAPNVNYVEGSDCILVKGWALNGSGVKKINIYIDGVLKGTTITNQSREDVNIKFPGYIGGAKSGYLTNVNLGGLKVGKHTLKVEPIGYDGTIQEANVEFYYKSKGTTIVVDAGHNYGGDYGAIAKHNGITYSETELNIKIADYLRTYLENAGYNVIMTRKTSDRDVSSVNQSLANRVSIANKSEAVLFISIHQNAATASAHGVEVYSTTNSPDKGYSWDNYSDKINKSRQLATKVVNSIASNVGFYNRGAKTANLYVLRNTRMPAILVECGFITNYGNATALSIDLNQRKIASSITDQVVSMFGAR